MNKLYFKLNQINKINKDKCNIAITTIDSNDHYNITNVINSERLGRINFKDSTGELTRIGLKNKFIPGDSIEAIKRGDKGYHMKMESNKNTGKVTIHGLVYNDNIINFICSCLTTYAMKFNEEE